MKITKDGSAAKQIAYAQRSFGAENGQRRRIALEVGYSESSANSIIPKIESKKGYLNAMGVLVKKSNDLAINIFDEFKRRDIKDFTNKELIQSLSTISNAMDRFSQRLMEAENPDKKGSNRLRTLVLQNLRKPAPITPPAAATAAESETPKEKEEFVEVFKEVEVEEDEVSEVAFEDEEMMDDDSGF